MNRKLRTEDQVRFVDTGSLATVLATKGNRVQVRIIAAGGPVREWVGRDEVVRTEGLHTADLAGFR